MTFDYINRSCLTYTYRNNNKGLFVSERPGANMVRIIIYTVTIALPENGTRLLVAREYSISAPCMQLIIRPKPNNVLGRHANYLYIYSTSSMVMIWLHKREHKYERSRVRLPIKTSIYCVNQFECVSLRVYATCEFIFSMIGWSRPCCTRLLSRLPLTVLQATAVFSAGN
jgi:hypothetical protein